MIFFSPHNRFVIVYEQTGFPSDKHYIFDSDEAPGVIDQDWSSKAPFVVRQLTPKTSYTFSVIVYYATSDTPFTWPTDGLYKFETLGGVPTAPGKPLLQKGFNIWWEPSKENGAPIEEYSLEGYKTNSQRIVRRSTDINSSSTTSSTTNSSPTLIGMNLVEEKENITTENVILDEQWTVFYTGINNYWFAADLTDDLYRFRVRAKNAFGYSVYSVTSEEINQDLVSSAQLSPKTILYFVAIIVATILVVSICICISKWKYLYSYRKWNINGFKSISACKRPRNTKGHFIDTTMTDVELANLREMPRGAHFSNNILYRIAPLTDSDIAQLPEISRDKVSSN